MTSDLGDWAAVHAFASGLPGAEASTYFGGPAVKAARNGRPVITPSREPDSFCLHIEKSHKAMLLDLDPDRFWETPHYANYPALLVRYGAANGVADWIKRALELAALREPARKK